MKYYIRYMNFDQPLTFTPLFMERVWGGRRLETNLGKPLPQGVPIGESWELVDRKEAQSVVDYGELTGTTLHELWKNNREVVFGKSLPESERFPLLAKILDAQDTLSVQVHPPARLAAELEGEPKTEMWYLLDASPEAAVYAGFKTGTTRESFERVLAEGKAAELLHRIPVQAGDAIFIPSGRCHAIGAGCLIVELQQNSDTTYRVFDWNRVGLDGKPRALHIAESLQSTDFGDIEPELAKPKGELITGCEFFRIERWDLSQPRRDTSEMFALYTVLSGEVSCGGRQFTAGQFFLLPAAATNRELVPANGSAQVLRTSIPIHG